MNEQSSKFYSLPMFPYPSGTAMHVWHASNFLITDVIARYHRMLWENVVFPIGYDSFGLPTENFAIKNNKSARQATEDNIVYFEEQLKGIDFSFDENRKFKTSDPEYYKWTQWIFMMLFNSWYNMESDKAESIDLLVKHFETGGSAGIKAVCDERPTLSNDLCKMWYNFYTVYIYYYSVKKVSHLIKLLKKI